MYLPSFGTRGMNWMRFNELSLAGIQVWNHKSSPHRQPISVSGKVYAFSPLHRCVSGCTLLFGTWTDSFFLMNIERERFSVGLVKIDADSCRMRGQFVQLSRVARRDELVGAVP